MGQLSFNIKGLKGIRKTVANDSRRCIITLIITIVLLDKGLRNPNLASKSISHLWRLGFGAVSDESLINIDQVEDKKKMMVSILMANAPQAILSFLSLTYNGLFSSMLLMKEWSGFAQKRKALRVTWPTGIQRSTTWLQLPYWYGVPLLIAFGTLHWLVSQSIFLVHVVVPDEGEWITTCGYSNIAIISVIILGSIIVLFGILTGLRKYKAGMPFVGSCSAAISAACHSLENDPDASLRPVMWGAVKTNDLVGHCCFSSLDVSPPIEGQVYAGAKGTVILDALKETAQQPVQMALRR